jgi:2-dehydro-3-deoxygluconokinase
MVVGWRDKMDHNLFTRVLEVVTFGETMALFNSPEGKGIEQANHLEKSFGGAESNLAIGLARLGHSVGWFGHLGKDPLGQAIIKTIRGENIDVTRAMLSSEKPTGIMLRESNRNSLSVYYYRKHSAASFMVPEDLDVSYISQAKILHVTGITPALSPSCAAVIQKAVQIAKSNGVKISFDPNLRLKLWTIEEARPILLELAEAADYFLPGMDELKLLYETEDEAAILNHVSRLQAVTIIKNANGKNLIVDGANIIAIPFTKVEHMVDPVGAGDGFCAGFLAGILKGYSYEQAVRLASIVGSLVIQAQGDWESLPTWEQVDQIMNQTKHIER